MKPVRALFLFSIALAVLVSCGDGITGPDPTTTLPSVPPDALFVIGSWGTGDPPQGMVAGEMSRLAETMAFEAILTTGDNLYTDDYERVLHSYDWVANGGIEFWIAWGESDVVSPSRVDAVNDAFGNPPRWKTEQWGRVRIIILDSTQPASTEQQAFLADTLASSDTPTIVVQHHPKYTCGPGPVVSGWEFDLDDSVFLVLSGRDRDYQRFDGEDSTWMVTGGGGEEPQPIGNCPNGPPEPKASFDGYHYLVLTQTATTVTVEARDLSGDVVDRLELALP